MKKNIIHPRQLDQIRRHQRKRDDIRQEVFHVEIDDDYGTRHTTVRAETRQDAYKLMHDKVSPSTGVMVFTSEEWVKRKQD